MAKKFKEGDKVKLKSGEGSVMIVKGYATTNPMIVVRNGEVLTAPPMETKDVLCDCHGVEKTFKEELLELVKDPRFQFFVCKFLTAIFDTLKPS